MKRRNRLIYEVIHDFGCNLAVAPLDFLVKIGAVGRMLGLLLLFLWCLPVLVIFTFVAFLFWLFERR